MGRLSAQRRLTDVPAWMGRPTTTSWRAPREATSARSARWSRRHAGAGARRSRGASCGNDALAEEIVQDAFLRVWINAPRWRPEAAFRTWLYRVVVNLCLNAKRRAGRPAARRRRRSGRSRARCRRRARSARARPAARRRDRCAAGAPARRDRAHLSGRAQQRRGRRGARHLGLGSRDSAGPRQARAARGAWRRYSARRVS